MHLLTFITELYTEMKLINKSRYRKVYVTAKRICDFPEMPRKEKELLLLPPSSNNQLS